MGVTLEDFMGIEENRCDDLTLDQGEGHRNDHETDQNPQPEARKVPQSHSKFVRLRHRAQPFA